jgi:branched-chain amino acid transport system substrate-binding protein
MHAKLSRGLLLLTAILLVGISACTTPPGRRAYDRATLSRAEIVAARSALAELRGHVAAERWELAEELGLSALDAYPGFESEDELLWLTAGSAMRRGRSRVAERLWLSLARDHRDSAYSHEAQWSLAQAYGDRGDWVDEARTLIPLHDLLAPDAPRRELLRRRLRELFDREMELGELDAVAAEFGQSFVGSSVHWAAIESAEAEGAPAEELGPRLERFLRDYPRSGHSDEASAWLARLERRGTYASAEDVQVARVDRIGVLSPLSGEYAALGQALYDGAQLALEEHNRAIGDSLSMIGLDTRGDEVVAVQSARELIEKDQVIAIVGALTSSTTTAVAVLCQERGVPLISPTATNENISQLGSFVFQTNLTQNFETQLVARVAVEALLRRRFAILYPDDEDGRSKADVFAAEVERLGARVVSSQPLQRGQTDFGAAIRRVRDDGPEALFLPVAPSEMRLLGPQLVFNDLRVQLLGPSTWNNSSLLRQAKDSLDRAVIPSDQALVSQEQSEHFARQWRRRFPERAASPFAQKSYFAMRRVIDSLDPDGEDTRERLRSKIESAFLMPGESGDSPFEKLRVLVDGSPRLFPVADFPGLTAPMADAAMDSLEFFDFADPGEDENDD